MRKVRGFTLIELMIVVAIVAIIAAIAIPAYNEQVRKGRRAEALGTVGDLQMRQERWRADNPAYGTAAQLGGLPPSDFYNFAAAPDADNPATNYQITAQPAGAQSGDRCGTLTATRNAPPSWDNAACN